MAVRLDAVPAAIPLPRPPRPIVWLLLLGCIVGGGAALALFFWPKGTPASGARFWLRVLGWPLLGWVLLLGLRVHIYDQQLNYARDRNRRRELRLAAETQRGQRPLMVHAVAYECALGGADLDSKLANDGDGMQPVRAPGSEDPVRCSMLPPALRGPAIDAESITSLISHTLKRIGAQLEAVPPHVPVHVRLQADVGIEAAMIEQIWQTAATPYLPSRASLDILDPSAGLLVLDQWLDTADTDRARGMLLIVALQLHPSPAQDTGEAAVALLVTSRNGYDPSAVRAILHRPVETGEPDVTARLADTLLWGDCPPGEIEAVWTSGFGDQYPNEITAAIDDAEVGASVDEGAEHFDLDKALGDTGAAAGWLAVAAAIERCCKEKRPQLVTASESGHKRLLVIAPTQS